ncbi:MAG: hypothetical protein R2816_05065 [Flavobacteriaceae bacterium]|nr:hypothetical protein [Flavobacteriaceae bacterium]
MNNITSLIKDIVISAIIAVFTSGLFKVSNTIYQSVIAVLILIIIFLILRGIDKMAKRMEIISILYVENLILPFIQSVYDGENLKLKDTNIKKVKLFIILPESINDLYQFKTVMSCLDTIEIVVPIKDATIRSMRGKLIDQNLMLFDSPMSWLTSLNYLRGAKGMSDKKITQLLRKMTDDIKVYTKKMTKKSSSFENIKFISFAEFEQYYN